MEEETGLWRPTLWDSTKYGVEAERLENRETRRSAGRLRQEFRLREMRAGEAGRGAPWKV